MREEHWRETRVLTEDIEFLTGIPKTVSEDFLLILENLIVHKFIETLDNRPLDADFSIELPYLGTLVVSAKGSRLNLSINFVPSKEFYKKIRNAYSKGISPLISQCENILSETFLEDFKNNGGDN